MSSPGSTADTDLWQLDAAYRGCRRTQPLGGRQGDGAAGGALLGVSHGCPADFETVTGRYALCVSSGRSVSAEQEWAVLGGIVVVHAADMLIARHGVPSHETVRRLDRFCDLGRPGWAVLRTGPRTRVRVVRRRTVTFGLVELPDGYVAFAGSANLLDEHYFVRGAAPLGTPGCSCSG